MKKALVILLCLINIRFAVAQVSNTYQDATLEKRYLNDTLGFTSYPDAYLLDNLKTAKKYKQLELNVWLFSGHPNTIDRYPFHIRKLTKNGIDTSALSKPDPFKVFINDPEAPWYISARGMDDQITTIDDELTLKAFLKKVNNPFNAYLWLSASTFSIGALCTDVKTSTAVKYKKVRDGYLISYTSIDGGATNRSETHVDLIYLITSDFKIIFISKLHPKKSAVVYMI